MQWIRRTAEPAALAEARPDALKAVRKLVVPFKRRQAPDTYRKVAGDLWRMQHYKCCYCEISLHQPYNDVEHYRPFSRYWWLGWDWDNLMFACARCNRSHKNDEFELAAASVRLIAEERPPGRELPLLIDPSIEDPRDHIRHVHDGKHYWIPTGTTDRGTYTIRLLALDDDGNIDRLLRHYETAIVPALHAIKLARRQGLTAPIADVVKRVTRPDASYCCFAQDVLAIDG